LKGGVHIGLYPLLGGDRCWWLAADFDGPEAMLDALMYVKAGRALQVPVALIKAVQVPAWTGFAGAAQVAQVRRTVTRKGRKTVEVVYLITSDRDADPATLAAWARGHWERENRLHWVRNVTYQEDKSLVRTGNAARVMASLRSLAISLLRLDGQASIAAANRHHARDPQQTLKAASSCMSGFAVSLAAGLPL